MCLVLCHDPCARCHALQVIKGLGLFGGAGALDAALSEVPTKEARIEFKWYNDINPAACATVEANYPHIHVSAATTSLKQNNDNKAPQLLSVIINRLEAGTFSAHCVGAGALANDC